MNNFADYNPTNLKPTFVANRFDNKRGDRFYYFEEHPGSAKIVPGITTWLGKVTPESSFLIDWKLKWGSRWEEVLNATAEYGTALHVCIEHIMKHNSYPDADTIQMAEKALEHLRSFDRKISPNMLRKNLISVFRFKREYNIEPVLIEGMLIVTVDPMPGIGDLGKKYHYALALDMLCIMKSFIKSVTEVQDGVYQRGEKKGQPKFVTKTEVISKEVLALVDFKSNPFDKEAKGYYDSHKFQLMGAAKAIYQNFGLKAERLMNFSPLGWSGDVGKYAVKEWTITDDDRTKFRMLENMAIVDKVFEPSGSLELFTEDATDLSTLYRKVSYKEYADSILLADQIKTQADNGNEG